MKYLKVFNTDSEYQTFKDGEDYVTPNICLINENNTVRLAPIPMLAGDVAYWDGSKVRTTSHSNWNESLGPAIGVVVIPKGFAPDGKIRIIGLNSVRNTGSSSSSYNEIEWGGYGINTSLTYYTKVPITNNIGSASTGSTNYGYLPSDATWFSGMTSFVDSKAKYYSTSISDLIPSPYLGDEPNPEYYKVLEGNNVLSDFNGLNNTETLVGLGSGYTAANAAWKYKDGSNGLSGLQWYIPAMGELGYLMARLNEINATITALGGLAIPSSGLFWSSSEYSRYYIYIISPPNGYILRNDKGSRRYVRPFAIIE